jgi:WD40 repeat protein
MKIELSHDILAQKVYERVSLEDKRLREVERLIRERFAFYQGEPKLGQEEVEFIRPYLSKVELSAEERAFVNKSRQRITQRRVRRLVLAGLIFLGIIAGLSIYAINMANKNTQIEQANKEAIEERDKAEAAREKADSLRQEAEMATRRALAATAEADSQRTLAVNNADRADRNAKRIREDAKVLREQATTLERQADSLNNLTDNLIEANRVAEDKRQEAMKLRDIAQQKARAANLLTAQSLANQSLKIKDLDPANVRIKRLLAREAYRIHEQFRQDSTREWASRYDPQIYNALYDALAIDSSTLNQVTIGLRSQQRFQLRALDRGYEHLYALTSNGYLIRWGWDRLTQTLSGELPLIDQPGSDIYFLQAISESDGLLSTLGGMRGIRSFDLLARTFRSQSEEESAPDLIAIASDSGHTLLGQRQTDGQSILYFKHRPSERITLSEDLIEMVINHSGQWLAGRDQARQLWAYRLRPGDSLSVLQAYPISQERYSRLHFRPGTNELIAGREDGSVERLVFLNTDQGAINPIEMLRGHSAQVSDLAFDETGRYLASASFDGTVQVWDLANDRHQRFGPLSINVPGGLLQSVSFVPGDTVLVSGDNEGNLRTWPIDPHRWYLPLLAKLPLRREKFDAAEVQRYLGDRSEIESSGLFEALPEYR